MLILTRRVGESVHIGEQVLVKVLSVRGSQVRLGIDAPREIKVNRDEVVNPRSKREVSQPTVGAETSGAERPPAEAAREPSAEDGEGARHNQDAGEEESA